MNHKFSSPRIDVQKRLRRYIPVILKAELSHLTANELEILPYLQKAASEMDLPYWIQEFGKPSHFLNSIDDLSTRKYCELNYGPWDRMFGNEPILEDVGRKPGGANFYPDDMTEEEFEIASSEDPVLKSPYTMVRRTEEQKLISIPYHEFFRESVESSIQWLRRAAANCHSAEFKRFLALRVDALHSDDYRRSDLAWMELSSTNVDLLIGPTEIVDKLFGIKTAYTGTVFIRNRDADQRLIHFQSRIPELQASLPIPNTYKDRVPKSISQIRVYDMIYAAGLDRRSIPTGIAWPDDEVVQSSIGIRSIIVDNMLRAKFNTLIEPLSKLLVSRSQLAYVRPEARLLFVLLHEIAHGMGIRILKGSENLVREQLRDLHYVYEEAKANLMAIWMALQLAQNGQLSEEELMPLHVTSLVSLLYNIYARQSILQLNYFRRTGAYIRDPATGRYSVQPHRVSVAVEELLEQVLVIQANGDYKTATALLRDLAEPDEYLTHDFDRINQSDLPLDIYIEDTSA